VAVVRLGRSRLRWLALLHPVLTVAVVVVTANHFWADGVVAVALLLLAYAAQWVAAELSGRRRPVAVPVAAEAVEARPVVAAGRG
jgi:hypothetical protein